MGYPEAEITLSIVGDRRMRALNRRYRQIDHTTDVLSFSLCEGEFSHINPDLWGDIVISGPRAKIQALDAGHSLEMEMAFLLLHGILHLMGLNHEGTPSEAGKFKKWQQKLWSSAQAEVNRWKPRKNSNRASSAL